MIRPITCSQWSPLVGDPSLHICTPILSYAWQEEIPVLAPQAWSDIAPHCAADETFSKYPWTSSHYVCAAGLWHVVQQGQALENVDSLGQNWLGG